MRNEADRDRRRPAIVSAVRPTWRFSRSGEMLSKVEAMAQETTGCAGSTTMSKEWDADERTALISIGTLVRSRVWIQPIEALIKQARKLPRELYKSLTWDRGKEMADHQRFSLATDIR